MTYDDWKLATPPEYEEDGEPACSACRDDICSCEDDPDVEPCIGADCVNPHPFHDASECATVEQMQAYEAELELLPLNPYCPLCRREHDVGETFSGRSHDCASCGALLQAADDGKRMWMFVEKYPTVMPRTSRQRTRALWRKRGRR